MPLALSAAAVVELCVCVHPASGAWGEVCRLGDTVAGGDEVLGEEHSLRICVWSVPRAVFLPVLRSICRFVSFAVLCTGIIEVGNFKTAFSYKIADATNVQFVRNTKISFLAFGTFERATFLGRKA